MRTSEAAAAARVNIQTLRYYERRGLLPEPPRLGAGHRRYDSTAVRRVRFIKRAQELGFSLDEIRQLLALRTGRRDLQSVRTIASAKISDIDRRMRRLAAMRSALAGLVSTCASTGDRRACPIIDALEDDEGVSEECRCEAT